MIQDCVPILDIFSKHFNSRFITLDFIDNADKLMDILNQKIQKEIKYSIKLPNKDDKPFHQLISFRYAELLDNIIKRVKIEDENRDNYLSEMEPGMLKLYEMCLSAMVQATTIKINYADKSFDIECAELFVELLWSPISQFHTSVLLELEHLGKMVEISTKYMELSSDKPGNNLFINSKVSTPFSYFILAFVAENLNVPLKL
jgi:hypothetical protein